MYRRYWGLRAKPFDNTLDPAFLYYSREHEEALVRLLYTVSESKGLMLLTGESGCGKTYLCHSFRRELAYKGYRVGMIVNPANSPGEILKQISYEFDLGVNGDSKAEVIQALKEFALLNLDDRNYTILLIDEAHLLTDPGVMEELRLLLNLKEGNRFLVTLILMGQSRLRGLVKRVPEFATRIGVTYTLRPFSETETRDYVLHRLRVAGADRPMFTDAAFREVFAFSHGIPLRANNITDLSLLLGAGRQAAIVEGEIVREAAEELAEYAGHSLEGV